MHKGIKILIAAVVLVGAIGLGLSSYDNKEAIKETMTSDITVKDQSHFNLFLQGEITPIKESTNNILQLRKLNTEMDSLILQNKIKDIVKSLDIAISNIDKTIVKDTQENAKAGTLAALNNMRYSLTLLDEESRKENFKIQGNETVTTIFNNISAYWLEIDDFVGLAETVR